MNPEKEKFSEQFRAVQPKFARLCARNLTKTDLSMPQYLLLNLLAGMGTIPMTELSEKLYISKPAVTNLVDRLEKGHYLKRLEHPKDRRVYLIEIQPKGEKLVRQMQTSILEFLLEALEQFNSTERKTITRFYELLSNTMDEFLNAGLKK